MTRINPRPDEYPSPPSPMRRVSARAGHADRKDEVLGLTTPSPSRDRTASRLSIDIAGPCPRAWSPGLTKGDARPHDGDRARYRRHEADAAAVPRPISSRERCSQADPEHRANSPWLTGRGTERVRHVPRATGIRAFPRRPRRTGPVGRRLGLLELSSFLATVFHVTVTSTSARSTGSRTTSSGWTITRSVTGQRVRLLADSSRFVADRASCAAVGPASVRVRGPRRRRARCPKAGRRCRHRRAESTSRSGTPTPWPAVEAAREAIARAV